MLDGGVSQFVPKCPDLKRGGESQEKLASEAYRTIGGVARNSIANRAKVGHSEHAIWNRNNLLKIE